ncbi:hypothetical protein PSCICM_04490 [Pseudomonas cichorii]|uniref:Uncharacterized protein n=1 Tax=Pseudomonas cichorii TaxID=36746 RepID=A0ABQ1DTQ7_PSECI|nr:hypothetical protein PSCICM_04490 [Pseudomonas cichorii]GFM94417.1 hypothetical protein PSCICP_43890 [Pseudomonas cichorii]
MPDQRFDGPSSAGRFHENSGFPIAHVHYGVIFLLLIALPACVEFLNLLTNSSLIAMNGLTLGKTPTHGGNMDI